MRLYNIYKALKRRLINLYFRCLPYRYGVNTSEKRDKKIIVSLTSYPSRFDTLPLTIKSLLYQTKKPDKILLVLNKEESEKYVTNKMRELLKYGLEIVLADERQIKAHNKYYYAMRQYPDDIIITADDDILYPHCLVDRLYKSYLIHPYCVNAARTHRIMFDENDGIIPYNQWKYECADCRIETNELFATGCAGCLYPPYNEMNMDGQLFDADIIAALCLNADDVWLKCMEARAGIKTVYVPRANPFVCENGKSGRIGLYQGNVLNNENDICIKNVLEYYRIDSSRFKDENTGTKY